MAPERMENLVAIPIERKVRELAEVKDIRTLAGEGSLVVYVDLKDEIGNVNAAWQRLRDKMGDVKADLPDGVAWPVRQQRLRRRRDRDDRDDGRGIFTTGK